MKYLLFMLAISSVAAGSAFADNLNYYCLGGSETYDVARSELAVVIQDGRGVLYARGELDRTYRVRFVPRRGFLAYQPKMDPNRAGPRFMFGRCIDGRATVDMVAAMAPSARFSCLCEQE